MTGTVYDIAVIGGGPAGMAAALEAAAAGASTVLIDDSEVLGGHYYKELPASFRRAPAGVDHKKDREFKRLKQAIAQSGTKILPETRVWGIFNGTGPSFNGQAANSETGFSLYLERSPAARTTDRIRSVDARSIILATGVYDRPLPFPGWELPGVITPGAVQMQLEMQGLLPGQRVLVAGSGPLQLVVAAALARKGAEVVALLDTCGAFDGIAELPSALGGLASRAGEGLESLSVLLRRRVPLLFRHAVFRALGTQETGVQGALIGRVDGRGAPIPGSEREIEVDTICTAFGFIPSIAMTLHLGCEHHYDENLSAFIASHDDRLRTSQPGVYVAGDVTGVGGKPLAVLQGRLAAFSALEQLGKITAEQAAFQYTRLAPALRRERRFARFLWKRYRVLPGLLELADEDTLLCHCEAVRFGTLRESLRDGASDLFGAKLRTRIGMGSCQGRYCLPTAALFLAAQGRTPAAQLDLPSIRPPVYPVRLGDIASLEQPAE